MSPTVTQEARTSRQTHEMFVPVVAAARSGDPVTERRLRADVSSILVGVRRCRRLVVSAAKRQNRRIEPAILLAAKSVLVKKLRTTSRIREGIFLVTRHRKQYDVCSRIGCAWFSRIYRARRATSNHGQAQRDAGPPLHTAERL